MSSGIAYQQRASAPLTDVIGSSPLLGTPTAHPRTHSPRPVDHGAQLANDLVKLLPTPMARTHGGAEVSSASRKGGRMLEESVKLLPTPNATLQNYDEDTDQFLARREKLKERHGNGNGIGLPLGVAVRLLPTLRERDWKGRGYDDGLVNTLERAAASPSTGPSSSPPSDAGSKPTALRLNPSFVEWMMGAPDGWSNPDCLLSATEFRSRSATSPGATSSTSSGSD
jgi:hypothetical protein